MKQSFLCVRIYTLSVSNTALCSIPLSQEGIREEKLCSSEVQKSLDFCI